MLVIFGGSFNPPTLAHKQVVDLILDKYKEAKVIIMPTNQDNYFWKDNLASNEDRYNMLKLAFPNLEISNYEFLNTSYLGTYEMLRTFSKRDKDIYFVIGTDNLKQMKDWKNSLALARDFKFLLIKRPTDEIDFSYFKDYIANFIILNMHSEINATMIRKDVNKHKNWLNKDVYDYIIKNKVYEV